MSGQSGVISIGAYGRNSVNSGGRDHVEVGVGNSEGQSWRLVTAGDTSTEPSSLMLLVSRQEPPDAENRTSGGVGGVAGQSRCLDPISIMRDEYLAEWLSRNRLAASQ